MSSLVMWADERSPNLGVRVLARGAADISSAVFGEPSSFADFVPRDDGFGFTRKHLALELVGGRNALRTYVAGFERVLDTGAGDSFTDTYGLTRLAKLFAVHRFAARAGVPVIMLPQTIGPFRTAVGRRMARSMLRTAAFVAARDTQSAEVAALLGRRPDVVTTDLVFALPHPAVARSRDVVLNVSGLLWSGSRHVPSARYRADVVALYRALRAAGRTVSLLVHVLPNPAADDDMKAVEPLQAQLGEPLDVIVPKDLTEAREVLGSASLVIASRMHACLNSLSMGVPAIAWAYSRKFDPLMRDLGWTWSLDVATETDLVGRTMALAAADPAATTAQLAAVRERADAGLRHFTERLAALAEASHGR